MDTITVKSFEESLIKLVEAKPRNSKKATAAQNWIQTHFGCESSLSIINETKQIYNRVTEQFSHNSPIVVFVRNNKTDEATLVDEIKKKVGGYPKIEVIAVINYNGSFLYEHLFIVKQNVFSDWMKESIGISGEPLFTNNDSISLASTNSISEDASGNVYFDLAEREILNSLQIIVYGTPGSGKSFKVKKALEEGAVKQLVVDSYKDYLKAYTRVNKKISQYNNYLFSKSFWAKCNKSKMGLSAEYTCIADIKDISDVGKVLTYLTEDPEGIELDRSSSHQMPRNVCKYYIEFLKYKANEATGVPATQRIIKRTIFHPDTDYATFVGSYKPSFDEKEKRITYTYGPQVFIEAYVAAWTNPDKTVYLVIEEINRGNCAQIFGALFQLLDRKDGYSEYPISPEKELQSYLAKAFEGKIDGIDGLDPSEWDYSRIDEVKDASIMSIPDNLHIVATMNTSDQSLFPMDSAFKRRWDWLYIPIDYEEPFSGEYNIYIGPDHKKEECYSYNWLEFLRAINNRIYTATTSEDKQMGNFFIKGDIYTTEFVNKVMFYLWSEICKDEGHSNNNFFFINKDGKKKWFSFNQLFPIDHSYGLLKDFIDKIISSDKATSEE